MKKIIALFLTAAVSASMLVPVYAADSGLDIKVEAESSKNLNFLSTGGAAVQNKATYSNGKYLNLFYPSDGTKEWYAEYSVEVGKAGFYKLEIASTPIEGGWASPVSVSVNDEEPQALKGSKKQVRDWSADIWTANTFYLNKGTNKVKFIVTKPRSDGNVCFFFDYFGFEKADFGIYAIKSPAPMQTFQESEEISFTVLGTGKVRERLEVVYEVLDYKGKMIEAGKTAFEKDSDTAEIKLGSKIKGSYQLLVSAGGQSMVKQFIVVTDMDKRTVYEDTPFAVDALPYGMANDINSLLSEDYADLIELSGITWIRDRIYFDPYVAKNGNNYTFTMPHTMRTSTQLAERDVNVSIAWDWAPSVLRTGCYGKVVPTNLFDVYNFWKQLAEFYDGAVTCWEIGNEWDTGGAASNLDGADTYASFFKASALGIMDSDTDSEVYVSPFGATSNPTSEVYPGSFDRLLYENEIYNYSNIANYHRHNHAAQDEDENYANYYSYDSEHTNTEYFKQASEKFGVDVSHWNGETGIYMNVPGTDDYASDDQMAQAKYLVTSTVEDIAGGSDKKFFFDGLNFQEGGKAWGMTSRGNISPSAYAAWGTLSAMTYILGEGNYLGKIKDMPENVLAFAFKDGDDTAIVFYSTSKTYEKIPLSFNVGKTSAKVYDLFANEKTVYSNNGVYSFEVDGEPMYIKVNGDITTGIVSDEARREYHALPKEQKQATDADRVILLQQYEEPQRNGARTDGYSLTEDSNTVTIAVYNFNDYEVTGNIVGESRNGWEITPATKEVTVAPMTMEEVTFEIIPDGFKGQKDMISFYADMNSGVSSKTVIEANSKKVMDTLPYMKNGETGIRVNLENRLDYEKVVDRIDITVADKNVTSEEKISIEPKGTNFAEIPIEIDHSAKSIDLKATVHFESGEEFTYETSVPFAMARQTIDTSEAANFNIPTDGTVQSAMWYGNSDLCGDVWVATDENNFYLTAVVTDDFHVCNTSDISTIWSYDSIQFSIGKGLPGGSIKYYELGMAQNGGKTVMYCWTDGFGTGKVGVYNDADCKVTRNEKEKTTTYELAIPWSSLGDISYEDNLCAFSMLINDNDGMGRTGYLEWGSGIGASKNPAQFRTILFNR